jgi:hypothetical protein
VLSRSKTEDNGCTRCSGSVVRVVFCSTRKIVQHFKLKIQAIWNLKLVTIPSPGVVVCCCRHRRWWRTYYGLPLNSKKVKNHRSDMLRTWSNVLSQAHTSSEHDHLAFSSLKLSNQTTHNLHHCNEGSVCWHQWKLFHQPWETMNSMSSLLCSLDAPIAFSLLLSALMVATLHSHFLAFRQRFCAVKMVDCCIFASSSLIAVVVIVSVAQHQWSET